MPAEKVLFSKNDHKNLINNVDLSKSGFISLMTPIIKWQN